MEHNINKMSAYRSIPFWSINGELTVEKLKKQILEMKEVGIGGFFFHARGGLKTEYMSEKWFEMLSSSIEVAEENGLDVWLYDENGWPSGFGGGKLLREENYVAYIEMDVKDFFDENANAVYGKVDNQVLRISKESNLKEYYCLYIKHNFSYVDILNPRVTDEFIASTYDVYYNRYKDKFGKSIKGFFTDEPQFYRNSTPWSDTLPTIFLNEYGEDIFDNLIALFMDCPNCYKFRNNYWTLVNKLFIQNFIERIYNWCKAHNCLMTGHTIEESSLYGQMMGCAGVMPFYEYEDIPGIDCLTRHIGSEISAKQLDSVCAQFGKTASITETFGASGHMTTPKQFKLIGELQYVAGVNMMCQHLFPFSIKGSRKRDYPPFFSSITKWNGESKTFNDYFTTLGYNLSREFEEVNTLVIHPLRSAYLRFNRNNPEFLYPLEEAFLGITESLCSSHIAHHFGDETIIQKNAKVFENQLIIGRCKYSNIILPRLENISKCTYNLLKQFSQNGGHLIVIGDFPPYVDGEINCEKIDGNYQFEELVENNIIQIESESPRKLKSTLRGNILYIISILQTGSIEACVKLKNIKSIKGYDIINDKYLSINYRLNGDTLSFKTTFEAYDSKIYILNEGDFKDESKAIENHYDIINEFKACENYENFLPLDFAKFSIDGINYSKKTPISQIQDKLLLERYNGKLQIKAEFILKEDFEKLRLAIEQNGEQNICINGKKADLSSEKVIENCFDVYNLTDCHKGKNEIILTLNYYQNKNAYHILFDEGVTETLKNSLTLDTELETMFLIGNFSVDGRIETSEENFSKFDNLQIDKLARINLENLTETIPFANNTVKFNAEIEINSDNAVLEINYSVDAVKIIINGKKVKTLSIDNKADISAYIHKGKNQIELELYLSSQNLFGAHHLISPNIEVVTPNNFGYGNYGGEDKSWIDSYYVKNQGINKIILIES